MESPTDIGSALWVTLPVSRVETDKTEAARPVFMPLSTGHETLMVADSEAAGHIHGRTHSQLWLLGDHAHGTRSRPAHLQYFTRHLEGVGRHCPPYA